VWTPPRVALSHDEVAVIVETVAIAGALLDPVVGVVIAEAVGVRTMYIIGGNEKRWYTTKKLPKS